MLPAQSESLPPDEVPRRIPVLSVVGLWILEVVLLVILFSLWFPGGLGAVPGVNEPHYLCKSRHFWDETFCRGDVFLESADAHYLFYFTLGQLTRFFSLATSAWLGRLIVWTAIAIGWRYLVFSVLQKRFWSLLAGGVLLLVIDHFHFAGEWLIGGVEAKGLAYAFVFLGMGFLVQCRWVHVWWLFGLGAAFHVLVGGWAMIAALVPWLWMRGWNFHFKGQLISALLGIAFSLLGLIPALALTLGQDADIVKQANEIYTFERIAHHLLYTHIVTTTPFRLEFFGLALVAWVGLSWVNYESKSLRVFNGFVLATILIAILAVSIETTAINMDRKDLVARLLRYYWFRLSDIFVPAGVGIGFAVMVKRVFSTHYNLGAIMLSTAVICLLIQATFNQVHFAIHKRSQADQLALVSFDSGNMELNRKIVRDWIDVCTWIRVNTPEESRFLTPRAQSTFKWYAHRSEVVSWKDVPQDAVGIVNWRNRFSAVYGPTTFRFGLATLDAETRLLDLGRKYDAQFLVIERRQVRERKKELEFRYRYRQFLMGKSPNQATPFEKPLCLRQVYPNTTCSESMRKESFYLVYELRVPENYRDQVDAVNRLLDWYQQYEEYARQFDESQNGQSP